MIQTLEAIFVYGWLVGLCVLLVSAMFRPRRCVVCGCRVRWCSGGVRAGAGLAHRGCLVVSDADLRELLRHRG